MNRPSSRFIWPANEIYAGPITPPQTRAMTPYIGQQVWVAQPYEVKWPAIVWDERFASAEQLAEVRKLPKTHCLVCYYDDERTDRECRVVQFR
jgi:hypothetical protein